MDPADFYTGLVAELYGPLKSYSRDAEPYAAFIRQAGTPALELGCGDGDPLLELRRRGLDVLNRSAKPDRPRRLRRRDGTSQPAGHTADRRPENSASP